MLEIRKFLFVGFWINLPLELFKRWLGLHTVVLPASHDDRPVAKECTFALCHAKVE